MKIQFIWFCLVLPIIGCSSSQELTSRWRTTTANDSTGNSYYLKDQNLSTDIQNDDEFVYLSFSFGDRAMQRQVIGVGLTVWFDYGGGEDKRFGVHYPLRESSSFDRMRSREEGLSDTSLTFPDQFPDDVEIIGPEKDARHHTRLADTKGIDVKIENNEGTVKYTMRVPLLDNRGHLYGIGAQPGTIVGIGIETGGFSGGDRKGGERFGEGGEGGGGRMPGGEGGGWGRGGGGRRGGMGRMGGGNRQSGEDRKQLNVWLKTRLAAPESNASK